MKKITFLTFIVLAFVVGSANFATAQNLMTNGDLETWTDANTPTDWDKAESVTQESGTIHGGIFSAKQQAGTKDLMQNVAGIIGGETYVITYYYLDNDADAKSRIWSYWTAGGSTISDNAAELRPSTYSSDNASWQEYTVTLVAPATADGFRFEVRSYNDNAGSGFIYYDDFSVTGGGTVNPIILNAYTLSETEIDLEYNIDMTSVNASDYALTGTSSITFSTATIDATNAKKVHLSGASQNIAGDITLDNIFDNPNSTSFDFYAGIMPISYTNTTNPTGTMNDVNLATFQGIISANDAFNNVWISDATGAYNGVLIFDYDFDGVVAVGDEVLITATRTTYNDLTEIVNPELISTISTGNSPYDPTVIDGSDIDETINTDTDPGEKWEGQLVKINNFTVDSYIDYDYTCSWSDGSNTYIFHVGDNVDYHLNNISLNVGETYGSITGVVDWYSSGPYYRINPREQTDITSAVTAARIVGSMQGWNTTDPDYVMSMNANGVYELTKSLDAGDNEYKVVEGDTWDDPNYPSTNQHVILTATEDVTWKVNIDADLVMHTLPVVAGNFLEILGGVNWDPTELMGEMSDPEGDDVFTLELVIPEGSYEGKVTLNNNWDQSTGGNVPFTTDGVNATVFTYDFTTNTTTISGPPPPSATITFIVDDTEGMLYDGFYLKGSWDDNGNYDPSWNNGAEHSMFFDDGTNGDETADDHIWTCQVDLTSDGGSNTWEWGINDTEHNWVAGNWQFTVVDATPQTLSWVVPNSPALVINEIMYNTPGVDEEWVELYNPNDSDIDLEGWKLIDSDADHTPIIITSGYSIPAGGFFTISVATDGNFPFTPDFDGTGAFALNNGGDVVRIYDASGILNDYVEYDDGGDWPSAPDGGGPSLSLFDPSTDNALGVNWLASTHDGGTPASYNFPIQVLTPNGGEEIETGSTYDITWEFHDYVGDVKIELVKEGEPYELLVSGIPATDGSFSWYVFESLVAGEDYKIVITGLDDGGPLDWSDDYFTIMEPYIMPELVLTEIMYNPPEAGEDSLEFVEIYNKGEEAVNMTGFYFSQGVEFVFPDVDVLPDSFLLVAKNANAFATTFGATALEWTSGSLSNSGEDIELKDALDNVIDFVDFDDYLPWDTLADGYGPSLTLCNPDVDNNVPENWTHSVYFIAENAAGDSIWATPGFGCAVSLLPGFEADVTQVLIGGSVNFTDLTLGDPITWIWTFEGGTPDTYEGQTPPPITYDTEGTFDVTLYVSDGISEAEITYQDYINVINLAPPTNLMAEVGPFDDVQLTWNSPGANELIYDNNVVTGSYSYEGYTMSTHMSPTGACKLISLKYYTTVDDGDNTFNANVYQWDGSQPSTDLTYTVEATAVAEDWVEVDVSSQDINFTGDFVVGFGSINATTYLGYDANLDNGRSWDFDNVSEWTSWTEAYVIRAVVEYTDGKIAEIGNVNSDIQIDRINFANSSHPTDYSNVTTAEPINALTGASRALLGFNVYRDDVQINTSTVIETEFNDPEPTIGSHEYYVTAVYDEGQSGPSNVVSVVVTDINEIIEDNISVYPNPSDGMITIDIAQDVEYLVKVMDIRGKLVYENTINYSTKVNLVEYNKGIYLISLIDTSSKDAFVKKLIIR